MKDLLLILWLCFRAIVKSTFDLFITCTFAITGQILDDFLGTNHAKFPIAKLKAICRLMGYDVNLTEYASGGIDTATEQVDNILPLPEPDTRKWWQRIL